MVIHVHLMGEDLVFVEESEPNTHVMSLNDEIAISSGPCTELSSSVEIGCSNLRGECGGKLHGRDSLEQCRG